MKKRNSPIDDSFILFFIVSWSSRSSQATQVSEEVVRLTMKPRNQSWCDRGCVYVRERFTRDMIRHRHPHSRPRAVCGGGGFYHYSMRHTRHTVSGVMTI
jgi:hypothetical protein